MCNCIIEIEERIKKELSSKNEEYKYKSITSVDIQNTAIMFDSKQSLQLCSPVVIEYDILNKKDVLIHKKDKTNFTYHYCPFCGEKYENEKI